MSLKTLGGVAVVALALALAGCTGGDSQEPDDGCGCPELPDLEGLDADATVGDLPIVEVVPEAVAEAVVEVAVEVSPEIVAEVAPDVPVEVAAPSLDPISPSDLHAALDSKDFLLINVHVPDAGQVPKTDTHISYLDVPAIEAFIGSNLDSKVVIYCLSNSMSGIAGKKLVADGYRAIRYLDGGMNGWQQAGYPLESTPP